MNMKVRKIFFIRALEACATLNVGLNKVEKQEETNTRRGLATTWRTL
jgi:hypothetical protein